MVTSQDAVRQFLLLAALLQLTAAVAAAGGGLVAAGTTPASPQLFSAATALVCHLACAPTYAPAPSSPAAAQELLELARLLRGTAGEVTHTFDELKTALMRSADEAEEAVLAAVQAHIATAQADLIVRQHRLLARRAGLGPATRGGGRSLSSESSSKGGRGGMPPAAPAVILPRCGTERNASLEAAAKQAEQRWYGRSAAAMSANELEKAMEASAFPAKGVQFPVRYISIGYSHQGSHVSDLKNANSRFRVTHQVLKKQTEQLNSHLTSTYTGFSVRMGEVQFVNNITLAKQCAADQSSVIYKYARFSASTLTVVICDLPYLGTCINGAGQAPRQSEPSGVVISFSSLPGSLDDNYNQGATLTHEVGHWLGLSHVYEGGCEGEGDHVADTPPQLYKSTSCTTVVDSCPNQPGRDSVNNFMDYAPDHCMNQFTRGQVARMKAMVLQHRPRLVERRAIRG